MISALFYLAFFLPAITCFLYFLSKKKKAVLYLVPGIFIIMAMIAKLDAHLFSSEEGNMLIPISIAVLLLFVLHYFFRRKKGWNIISGFAFLFHILLSALLIFVGIHFAV